jgi:hypothetical protein
MRHRLMLAIVLLLVSLAEQQTPASAAQGTTYTDPFAYCAAVGTIDAPDARYAGPAVPDAIAHGLQTATGAAADVPLDRLANASFWRCMDGKVYACFVGANLPCQEQANTSQAPTANMTNYCRANADAAAIPAFVTGRATVYEWRCENGVATPGRQVLEVDTRGFIANIWHAITAEGAAGVQAMPRTGGARIFGGGMAALLALGTIAALLGLVLRRRAILK